MIQKFMFDNFSPQLRKIYRDEDQKKLIITIGARSYIVSGRLETFYNENEHILIGKYSSLAHRLTFMIGMNHDYRCITTYPQQIIEEASAPAPAFPLTPMEDPVSRHQIIIGNDVWVGANATIMGGIRIGNGAVIGAGAVVAKNIPPYAIAVGNPARIIKYRFDKDTVTRLQRIKWWNWPQSDIEEYLPRFNQNMRAFLDTFDVLPEQETSPTYIETIKSIQKLKADGYQIAYFVPDFDIDVSLAVWPRVIESYLSTYTADNPIALMLALPEGDAYSTQTMVIQSLLTQCEENAPLILSHTCSGKLSFSIEVLQESDVYITTREGISSICVDYAADADLCIRYGLDHHSLLFPPMHTRTLF